MQLEYRKGNGYLRRYRQLENDTKLVREENITLTQQVDILLARWKPWKRSS
jgi:hypothetical protein